VKRVTTIVAALSLLVVPASASAGERKEAKEDCRAERSAAGVENFRTLYDGFGQCVTQTIRENRAERRKAKREAVADCEGLEGSELKDCVRSERKQNLVEAEEHDQLELNAAQDCRAEQGEVGDEAFAESYGTNHNNRNAFGKCVSGRVNELEEEETETEVTPEDGEEVDSEDTEETQPEECEETTEPEDGEETTESEDAEPSTKPDDGGEETTECDDTEEVESDDGEEETQPDA
jgi:hypothetical protein